MTREQIIIQRPVATQPLAPTFSAGEWQTIESLREQYRQDRDLFSGTERARLAFVRWLYLNGRLVP